MWSEARLRHGIAQKSVGMASEPKVLQCVHSEPGTCKHTSCHFCWIPPLAVLLGCPLWMVSSPRMLPLKLAQMLAQQLHYCECALWTPLGRFWNLQVM